ncbi:glutamate decarboxylase [Roseibium sp. RKSG952]|uniref:glutamate decarboxylase n=1 Tax=Roseibium sp. RKSG952 TaxID=2529384 RepID=UPI0018AD22FB|nr:glutamate decarboxylase [Roseibium sp. RKSG952]
MKTALALQSSHDRTQSLADLFKPGDAPLFPDVQLSAQEALQHVETQLALDGNPHRNLATFCQTQGGDELHSLMNTAIFRNLADSKNYPRTAELERRCIQMLGELWNAPSLRTVVGTSATGSSEACMLGGLAAKGRWKARQKAKGISPGQPNIVCGPVQTCWDKFCQYWEIEKREIPMTPERLVMDPDSMLQAVDENTICVVPTLGVTFTGLYEPVAALSDALDWLERKQGLSIDIHVDAASGGFLAPFCSPDLVWDFRLPRVKSISASGHKYGLAPLGLGWILWRTADDLPHDYGFSVPYLGGSVASVSLCFSRPAGQVLSQYYLFKRLGRDGYRQIQLSCYEVANHVSAEIESLGLFKLLHTGDPLSGIPAVSFQISQDQHPAFNLSDLSDALLTRGWHVPAFDLTGSMPHRKTMRLTIRHGMTFELAQEFLSDLNASVNELTK